jgi:Na+-driven multidrug efflux pump
MALLTHGVFVAALVGCDLLGLGLYAEWAVATAFVVTVAFVWLWRFRAGGWRHIRVIETSEDP